LSIPYRLSQPGIRIGLIRLSSIGDLVLCTPVIRWLHKRFPHAELHFVTKAAMAPVLEHHPDLTRLHILHDHNEQELLAQLQSLRFDAAIDLHSNWRTLRWKFRLAPAGSGIPYLRFRKNNIH